MMRWKGRFALVTGASAGIGEELCRTLVREGINVIGCARSVENIEELAKNKDVVNAPGKLYPVRCDLSIESDILQMFEHISNNFGRVDICINNAGVNLPGATLTCGRTAEWNKMFQVNVLALCICTREAVKLMGTDFCEGQIINISSVWDREIPKDSSDMHFFYSTKSMVSALSKSLQREIKSNIRVACICPGLVKTDFVKTFWDLETYTAVYKENNFLSPNDIVDAAVYILKSPPHVEISEIRIQPYQKDMS